MTDLLSEGDSLESRYYRYKILERLDNKDDQDVGSTPDPTPTTINHRLARLRPETYRAQDQRTGENVIIKAVHHHAWELLENEWLALYRLLWWTRLNPLNPKIAPLLKSGLEQDDYYGIFFIVYEQIDDEWLSLGEFIKNVGGLIYCRREHAVHEMRQLRNAFVRAIRFLHWVGIVHGDNKDEHVFFKKARINGEEHIFFNQIKIIDFGECYLRGRETWKGGSLGFSSPYFCHPNHRGFLPRKELEAIDWYGVCATLYYAYTGECFPAASPAYTFSRDHKSDLYYLKLKETLKEKMRGKSDEERLLIGEVVECLCLPNPTLIAPQMSKIIKPYRFEGG